MVVFRAPDRLQGPARRPHRCTQLEGRRAPRPGGGARDRGPHRRGRRRARKGARALRAQEEPGHGRAGAAAAREASGLRSIAEVRGSRSAVCSPSSKDAGTAKVTGTTDGDATFQYGTGEDACALARVQAGSGCDRAAQRCRRRQGGAGGEGSQRSPGPVWDQYGYGVVEGGGVDEFLAVGWATCQVNLWPPKASMAPSPVTFPGPSGVKVYSRLPW